jgi:hypothetical protein
MHLLAAPRKEVWPESFWPPVACAATSLTPLQNALRIGEYSRLSTFSSNRVPAWQGPRRYVSPFLFSLPNLPLSLANVSTHPADEP